MTPFTWLCLFILLVFILFVTPTQLVADERVVTDYQGRTVVLSKPATRIVALAPHIVENIYSAGAGDLIVGAVSYSDYPQQALAIPRVGNIQGFSIEAIVALKPDLVIAWASGHAASVSKKLVDLGLNVYMDEPKTLEHVVKSISDIAYLSQRESAAVDSIKSYQRRLKHLQQRYAHQSPVSVLYQVWNSPLRTISGNHIISDVIRVCGGRNIFADAPVIAPTISIESVIERNPQVIIASGMGEQRPDWLDEWRRWHSITAVQKQQLFFIPPDILQRHTVRLLQGAQAMCKQLEAVRHNSIHPGG
ncbi:MAG: cobalamin-binding protein [Pseudomonadota bacterium]